MNNCTGHICYNFVNDFVYRIVLLISTPVYINFPAHYQLNRMTQLWHNSLARNSLFTRQLGPYYKELFSNWKLSSLDVHNHFTKQPLYYQSHKEGNFFNSKLILRGP